MVYQPLLRRMYSSVYISFTCGGGGERSNNVMESRLIINCITLNVGIRYISSLWCVAFLNTGNGVCNNLYLICYFYYFLLDREERSMS